MFFLEKLCLANKFSASRLIDELINNSNAYLYQMLSILMMNFNLADCSKSTVNPSQI